MALSKMDIVEWVEDLKKNEITPDEQVVVNLVENLAKQLKSRMNAKRYQKISMVRFFTIDCKDVELTRLITDELGIYAKDFRDYTSIVEVLTTASMLGYYISGYYANRGELWIELTKDFKYDNITPDLVEFISRTVENNVIEIEEHNNSMNKILDEIGMP